jgi:hypothetical protein
MDLPELDTELPVPSMREGVPRSVSIALYVLSAVGLILFIVLSVMGIITWVQQSKAKKANKEMKTMNEMKTTDTKTMNPITIL